MAFSEFRGNPQIVMALRGAMRAGRVPHALLFTGPRGVGKYTLARLFAQAANCERLTDDACGECHTCRRIALLAEPQRLIEQGLAERGESADAAMVERTPLILQTHPDVWALVPDPVRLKSPVARPVLRIGQLRAVQRAAYVFLKILEEPPGSATLILTAPLPYALLPTIVSRCMQFHFAPLPEADVASILKDKSGLSPASVRLAAQLSEGSPGFALEMDAEKESKRRSDALKILDRAVRGEEFGQLFAQTSVIAKDRETSFEEQLGVFYSLLSDLLEISSGIASPQIRNLPLRKDLEVLAKKVDARWVMQALRGLDQLAAGARRNLNRQLGLDALAAELSPSVSSRQT